MLQPLSVIQLKINEKKFQKDINCNIPCVPIKKQRRSFELPTPFFCQNNGVVLNRARRCH